MDRWIGGREKEWGATQRDRQEDNTDRPTDHECSNLHFFHELLVPKLSPFSSSVRMPIGSRTTLGGVLILRVQTFSELCMLFPH